MAFSFKGSNKADFGGDMFGGRTITIGSPSSSSPLSKVVELAKVPAVQLLLASGLLVITLKIMKE